MLLLLLLLLLTSQTFRDGRLCSLRPGVHQIELLRGKSTWKKCSKAKKIQQTQQQQQKNKIQFQFFFEINISLSFFFYGTYFFIFLDWFWVTVESIYRYNLSFFVAILGF